MKHKYFICYLFFLIIITGNTFGQKVGLHAGYSLSYPMYARFSDDLYRNTQAFEGFNIGLNFQIPLSKVFSLGTGLSVSKKGLHYVDIFMEDIKLEDYKIYYLQIPLTIRATHNIRKSQIYAEGGLYIARGLIGTHRLYENSYFKSDYEEKIRWDYDEIGSLKRYDFGIVSGLGVIFKSIQLGFNYEVGLTDIIAYKGESYSMKNSVFVFSIGYYFN